MNRQATLLAGIGIGAVAAIALIVYVTTRDKPGAPGSSATSMHAAESKDKLGARVMVCETTKERSVTHIYKSGDSKYDYTLKVQAERFIRNGAAETYVHLDGQGPSADYRCWLTAADAADLYAFYQKTKDVKASASPDVAGSSARWAASPSYPSGFRPDGRDVGEHYQVRKDFGSEYYYLSSWFGSTIRWVYLNDACFEALGETLKDLEKLKAAKPALELK